MQEYLLKVSKAVEQDVTRWLGMQTPPTHVRLSTIAPLSNWGYPAGSQSALLKLSDHGIVTGMDGEDKAPHDFIPWQNVAYLSDGTALFKEMGAKK